MIRRATTQEYPTLIEIWEEAVAATHEFLSEEHFEEIKTQMPQYLNAVDLYVYEYEGELLGFTGVSGDRIDMLFVKKRGSGIGTGLLDFAIADLGACRIEVNEENIGAKAFYERKGFQVSGRTQTDSAGRPYPLLQLELKGLKK